MPLHNECQRGPGRPSSLKGIRCLSVFLSWRLSRLSLSFFFLNIPGGADGTAAAAVAARYKQAPAELY